MGSLALERRTTFCFCMTAEGAAAQLDDDKGAILGLLPRERSSMMCDVIARLWLLRHVSCDSPPGAIILFRSMFKGEQRAGALLRVVGLHTMS